MGVWEIDESDESETMTKAETSTIKKRSRESVILWVV